CGRFTAVHAPSSKVGCSAPAASARLNFQLASMFTSVRPDGGGGGPPPPEPVLPPAFPLPPAPQGVVSVVPPEVVSAPLVVTPSPEPDDVVPLFPACLTTPTLHAPNHPRAPRSDTASG